MGNSPVIIIGMGWLGGAYARAMQARSIPVLGTVRGRAPSRTIPPEGVPLHFYSLGDRLPEAVASVAEGASVLIAVSPARAALSPDAFERRLEQLSDEVASAGAGRIVFISSTSVYPVHIPNPREEDAADIYSAFSGISLYRAEAAVQECAGDVPVVTIRFGGLFGAGREPGRFFLNKPLRFPDDPVNLIHLDDCIGIVDLAMTLDRSIVLNGVAPVHPERGVFYTAAALAIGEMPPMTTGPARSATPSIVNTDRLEKGLGYRFIHPDPLALFL